MKKRYLIFGNGFIAQHYAHYLLSRGEQVEVTYRHKKNSALPQDIQRKVGSHLHHARRILLSVNPHYVILTQGISFIPDNEKEIRNSVESNVIAPLLILEAMYQLRKKDKLKNIEKVLTFGSAAEYGDSDTKKWSEEARDTNPHSLYGLVKHWLFESSKFYAELGIPCVHIRQFNTIGAGQDSRFVVSSFCRQVASIENGGKPTIIRVGDLSQERDFIDIRDAVRAYELALKKAPAGQVINICSGTAQPVKEIVTALKRMSSTGFTVQTDPRLIVSKRTRNKILAGTPKWLHAQGWKPAFNLTDTVSWTLEYWRTKIQSKK